MTSEPIHNPLSAHELNVSLYYASRGATSPVLTVTVPINTSDHDPFSESTELPVPKEHLTIHDHANGSDLPICRNGLYFDKVRVGDHFGVDFLVMPLRDFAPQGQNQKPFRVFVSYEEDLGGRTGMQTIEIDMDEATGRVVIWGWEPEAQETRVFVGDLV